MQYPTINLNGTHGPDLLEQYRDALHAVDIALQALQAIDVNGRDYPRRTQPQPGEREPGAVALDEHAARWQAVHRVKKDLEEISYHLFGQIEARKTRAANGEPLL